MRTEQEVIRSVLDAAGNDSNVRAVIQTDLYPVREYLYAYSFCFIADDIQKYEEDTFAACFGDRILLYRGDRNYPGMFADTKAHLMVFRDGITISVNVTDKDAFLRRYSGEDRHDNVWIGDTYRKLLDKDGILPDIERLEERQVIYDHIPGEKEFLGACDEFWWVMKTFTEYTLREELPSAMFYLNVAVRDLLNNMLRWYIRLQYGCPVDMGILDSNMEKLLGKELFGIYRRTYPDADYTHIREARSAAAMLWGKAGRSVAERCEFEYPERTERDMLEFIEALEASALKR